MKRAKKILLTVDLKAEDPDTLLRVWKALKPVAAEGAVIVPVTVLDRQDIAVGSYLRSRIGKVAPAAERFLEDKLAKMGLKGLAPAKALVADGTSNHRLAAALLKHAQEYGADLIALGTHSRKGMQRVLLGSFAETLALRSSVPLLLVNPKQKKPASRIRTLLFPTDFSAHSRQGLQVVCDSFGKDKPKIVLYHRYQNPELNQIGPFGIFPIPTSAFDRHREQMQALGKVWCEELLRRGFKSQFLFDRKSDAVPAGIVRAAKGSKADWIAMVSTKGRAGAFFLGSLSREVVRQSPVPAWVVHVTKAAPIKEAKRNGLLSYPGIFEVSKATVLAS